MKKTKKLFYAMLALSATSFLMRTVSVWFSVYLTNKISAEGVGLMQLILSVYTLAKALAVSGMSLGATRFVVEYKESIDVCMKKLFISGFFISGFFGVIMYFSANFCATVWLKSPISEIPLKILAFALPSVAFSSAISGYFYAVRKTVRFSAVLVLEQIVRIIFTIILLDRVKNSDMEYSASAVVLGIIISEAFSLITCALLYIYDRRGEKKKRKVPFLKRFLSIAVPDCIGSLMRTGLNTASQLLTPSALKKSGSSYSASLAAYGCIQGMALPILLYPASILGVVSGLLVPEIAEAQVSGERIRTDYIIKRILHISVMFSVAVMGFMFVFGEELSFLIYNDKSAAYFIKIIAPLIPIMYIDMTTDGMLRGLDKQTYIMGINIVDSFLSVLLIYFLVPVWAVKAYVFVIYFTEIVNFILSYRKLYKMRNIGMSFFINGIFPCISVFLSTFSVKTVFVKYSISINALSITLCAVTSLFLYIVFLKAFKCVSKEEIAWIKSIFKN